LRSEPPWAYRRWTAISFLGSFALKASSIAAFLSIASTVSIILPTKAALNRYPTMTLSLIAAWQALSQDLSSAPATDSAQKSTSINCKRALGHALRRVRMLPRLVTQNRYTFHRHTSPSWSKVLRPATRPLRLRSGRSDINATVDEIPTCVEPVAVLLDDLALLVSGIENTLSLPADSRCYTA
jgi:hypothetical protein